MRKELVFGVSILGLIVAAVAFLMPWGALTSGHLGLLMLALIVAAIMLGFPTAFTLMGMGVMFAFFAYIDRTGSTEQAIQQTLDLMVQRAYAVMANDVLIAVPLFVFMGYLVERANLIERLFKSLHLAMARLPGSLAVATIFTCAVFATATGIVGAVVTLMGLLALPSMLKAGYDTKISAGSITAGGCLGILIPPSVLLIVYGATAGVSVVQLYAGAFFPGLMLAGLYILYVIVLARLKPKLMPPLPESERHVPLPAEIERVRERFGNRALPALVRAVKAPSSVGVSQSRLLRELFVTALPALAVALVIGLAWNSATAPKMAVDVGGLEQLGSAGSGASADEGGLAEPGGWPSRRQSTNRRARPGASWPSRPPSPKPPPRRRPMAQPAPRRPIPRQKPLTVPRRPAPPRPLRRRPPPLRRCRPRFWYVLGAGAALLAAYYAMLNFARLQIFRMLMSSFFPLAILILAVLGAIVFGLATPSEAAAVGSFGGFVLAIAYRALNRDVMKESVFLTAKTSAMVCWLFVGSSIFSAAFALLGGQEIIERWVLSLGLTKIQFLLLSQVIIFLLGWPLEWTEIIVIFMPIFIPLLVHFDVNPLFFGLLVALNLQTAFLSPPVAMAAFYLKGVAPPHVTLGQIFMGMMPFMGIQILAIFLLYVFPAIGLWLPEVLYR
ncbi:MAG: TRAP transporter large permease subunit [Burkholderiaceae bacterium]|nr:TRAP transporter large permease subunit [Burkholderiaceae bacterium]